MNKFIINKIELIKENCVGKLLEIFDEIEGVKEINGNNILLLKINIEKNKNTKKCKICNRDFKISIQRNCNKCFYIHKCKNCNKLFINNRINSILCSNKCSGNFKTKSKYCEICKKETLRNASGNCAICASKEKTKPKYCGICKKITKRNAFGNCIICNTKEIIKPKYCGICKKITKRNSFGLCIKCMVKEKTKPKYCEKCNKITNRNVFGNCAICASKEKTKSKYCEICKKVTKRNATGECIICRTNNITKLKYCKICKKVTKRNAFGLCIKCIIKPKYCELCKEITKRNAFGNCIICSTKEMTKPKYCEKCNKITNRNVSGSCMICNNPGGFNRDTFYASKLDLVLFESDNKIITLEEINNYNNISGVWSIWGTNEKDNKICLDVCETQDIGKEMLKGLRLIGEGRNNKDKTYEEIRESRSNYTTNDLGKRIKYKNIAEYLKYGYVIFKLVIVNILTKNERWDIESKYAHDNYAKYWNPAFGQKLISNINYNNFKIIKYTKVLY